MREGTGWVPYVTARLQKHVADLPWHFLAMKQVT